MDDAIIKPLAEAYIFAVPEIIRDGIANMIRNLASPLNLVHQTLQGDAEGAGEVIGRFIVNTTFGLAGFFDVGADMGMPYEREDFGQTLAIWGVDSGPYLMLPFFGPSNPRDAFGFIVDAVADPFAWYLRTNDHEVAMVGRTFTGILSGRAANLDATEELERSALDYYATVRSVWTQQRFAQIIDGSAVDPYGGEDPFAEFEDEDFE